MRNLILVASVVLLTACSAEPGSERWCKQMAEKPASELSAKEAMDMARHCVLDSQTIGSEPWCAKRKDKDKSEMTVDELASYTKHCVI